MIDDSLIFDDDDLALLTGEFLNDPDYSRAARHLLFVYGTMRRGARNHTRLHRPGVRFCGEAQTRTATFDLRQKVNRSGVIAPIATHTGNFRLIGELYDVPGPVLRDIDLCEGHPDIYQRMRVQLDCVTDTAWIYIYGITNAVKIISDGIRTNHDLREYEICQSDKRCSKCATT